MLSDNPLLLSASWLKLKNKILTTVPSRGRQPMHGPPRFSFTQAQKIMYGGGSILIMMIIPTWGLLSLPSWAIKHQNLGSANKPVEEEEVE